MPGADLLTAPLLAELLGDGRSVRLEVGGHSMTPFIRRGDVVTLSPRRDVRPSVGEVLVVSAGVRRFTVHRHVGWAKGRIVPRGDCAPASDTPVPLEDVIGVVTRVERRGRPVRGGLGPERRLIAWLSRIGLLGGIARLRERLRRSAPRDGAPGSSAAPRPDCPSGSPAAAKRASMTTWRC